VKSIEFGAFTGCAGLTGTLTIPNSVTSIGPDAFYGCSGLTSIIISKSVTSIGDGAFGRCTGLGNVILPARFADAYTNFGLTAAQVIFYDPSNLDPAPMYLAGQQSVINNPSAHNLYTATQYTANFNAEIGRGRVGKE
jgi:hypothetical protein